MSFHRYRRELYDHPNASLLDLKVRMVKVDVVQALLYGCGTWTLLKVHYRKLRTVHHRVLLRILGAWCRAQDHRVLSYAEALQRTGCESIETTVRTRRLQWAGALIRMDGDRLPNRVMFGGMEGPGQRGAGGKEKEWMDCVAKDVWAFGIGGDWKAASLEWGAWDDTVMEGGRRYMAKWREEEESAAITRQRKRGAEEADKVFVASGVTVGVTVGQSRRFRSALLGPSSAPLKRRRLLQ